MASQRVPNPVAMRKQHLLVEFAGLKTACPEGVFVSLSPGDATLWAGVVFVRKGPYAPAILRFQISFPPAYPTRPPLVTFSTDIFHPLITPLTTYTYTTDIQDSGTVSATDDERLPPGGFSLRHGFPSWFGRTGKSAASSRQTSGQHLQTPVKSSGGSVSGRDTPESVASSNPATVRHFKSQPHVSTYEVLRYIRSTFDDADVLDTVTLEAAGNPGAWHAWRSHRVKSGKAVPSPSPAKNDKGQWQDGLSDEESGSPVPEGYQRLPGGTSLLTTPRKPGEWSWEGVWEARSRKGIEGSLAEPVLYGNVASNDDIIRFLNVDADQLEVMKENMIRSLEPL